MRAPLLRPAPALAALLVLACEAARVPAETAPPGGPDLSVALAYVTQATQTPGFGVPLVAGRDGVLRVWVAATGPATAAPLARARVYGPGGDLLASLALPPPGPAVPSAVDEGSLAGSWNVVVPGRLVQPGNRLLVDVDSDRKILETDEANNGWPASGEPWPLEVVTIPALTLDVLSVRTADGRAGDASGSNLEYYAGLTRRLWPVPGVDARFGGSFTTSVTPASDGTGWGTMLSELEAKRAADGKAGHYYYGAVSTAYGGGVAGMGYVGGYTAVGWDKSTPGQPAWSSTATVLAHEIGHNFGLQHAPGCGAGGPDAAYPYGGDALIGVWGLDVELSQPKAPSGSHDVMSYCGDVWVSDYNYEKVLASLDARAAVVPGAAADAPEGLLLWGRVEGGAAVLEPAFHLPSVAVATTSAGPGQVVGVDAAGEPVFSAPVALQEAGCGAHPGDGAFAVAVPLPAESAARVVELRWRSGDGVELARRPLGIPRAAGLAARPPSLERLGGGLVRVRWDAATAEVVLIADPASDEVLGFGRGGVADVAPRGDAVGLRLPGRSPTVRLAVR